MKLSDTLKSVQQSDAHDWGSSFKVVNGEIKILSQTYHYDMRSNTSAKNRIRNFMTRAGKPSLVKTYKCIHSPGSQIPVKVPTSYYSFMARI